ncbi:MAG: prepilin-type N-terminal cleavage/methylation domain-containing protein [Defluviitaleaceae bacterium]|nr:prepilin-type N-terminal cleavage/methylation domain-containing protein [Defluviitaleaceae bacterium]
MCTKRNTRRYARRNTKIEKGLTLMEIVIVLAIVAIIGAIVAPNLFGTTERARLRSDIQSTIVLRNALDLYRLETGAQIGASIDQVLQMLQTNGYIAGQVSSPQTEGASWVLSNDQILLVVPADIASNTQLTNSLTQTERSVVQNIQ